MLKGNRNNVNSIRMRFHKVCDSEGISNYQKLVSKIKYTARAHFMFVSWKNIIRKNDRSCPCNPCYVIRPCNLTCSLTLTLISSTGPSCWWFYQKLNKIPRNKTPNITIIGTSTVSQTRWLNMQSSSIFQKLPPKFTHFTGVRSKNC